MTAFTQLSFLDNPLFIQDNITAYFGKEMYFVNKCSIIPCYISSSFSSGNTHFLFLTSLDEQEEYRISSDEIGETLFLSEEQAKEHLNSKCECIQTENMNILFFKSYKNLKTQNTAFFCFLENGYVYIKDFYSVPHLIRMEELDMEQLNEDMDLYSSSTKETKERPILENMYKCINHPEWEYASYQFPYEADFNKVML